jgi:hypothetical protein
MFTRVSAAASQGIASSQPRGRALEGTLRVLNRASPLNRLCTGPDRPRPRAWTHNNQPGGHTQKHARRPRAAAVSRRPVHRRPSPLSRSRQPAHTTIRRRRSLLLPVCIPPGVPGSAAPASRAGPRSSPPAHAKLAAASTRPRTIVKVDLEPPRRRPSRDLRPCFDVRLSPHKPRRPPGAGGEEAPDGSSPSMETPLNLWRPRRARQAPPDGHRGQTRRRAAAIEVSERASAGGDSVYDSDIGPAA